MDHGLTRQNALRASVAKVKNQGVTETRGTPGSWASVALRPVSGGPEPWLPRVSSGAGERPGQLKIHNMCDHHD